MSYALDKKDPLKKNLINQDEKLQIFKEDAEQFISQLIQSINSLKDMIKSNNNQQMEDNQIQEGEESIYELEKIIKDLQTNINNQGDKQVRQKYQKLLNLLLKNVNKLKEEFLQVLKGFKKKKQSISGQNIQLEEEQEEEQNQLQNLNLKPQKQGQLSQIYDQMIQEEVKIDEKIVQKRQEDIDEIEDVVQEVHGFMNQMALQVKDEGQKVDMIQDNVEKADEEVQDANIEILGAKKYKKKSMKKCIIAFIGLIVVIVLIWLTIYLNNK